MEIKQQLRLSQQLVMTPQLQQAIRLLQMSRNELADLVRDEMLENPVLEDQGDFDGGGDQAQVSEPGSDDNNINAGTSAQQDTEAAAKDGSAEMDWERYLENHALQSSRATSSLQFGDGGDERGFEAVASPTAGLAEHLEWQMRLSDLVEEEMPFAALVVGNLDDRGYLRLEGIEPEQVVPHLAKEATIDPEDAEEVLSIVQRFDPIGVAARSLKECLSIQARHYGFDDLVLRVIDEHLGDLESRRYPAIAKAQNVSLEDVYDVAQTIMELEPRPARAFTTDEPHYITPDVYVHRVGDNYFVVANDEGMPRLRISGFYRSAMSEDSAAKDYIQSKLRSAQWLIRSIDQRRKTIVRVTESIVEQQREFFEKGIEFLRPMVLKDVADAVGMHESTISRVTSNKYVHTPRGLFELKFFFNSGIRRDERDDIASESVKQAIRKLVTNENPKKPLSDQKLVDALGDEGIVIARRTVAKYREMLGILSSAKRKRYF